MKISAILLILLAGGISLILSWITYSDFGDKIAHYVGDTFLMLIMPGLIYAMIIMCESIICANINRNILKVYWIWIVIGTIISYIPLILVYYYS